MPVGTVVVDGLGPREETAPVVAALVGTVVGAAVLPELLQAASKATAPRANPTRRAIPASCPRHHPWPQHPSNLTDRARTDSPAIR